MFHSRRRKPLGQPTRGKTALNRLRRIDVYLALTWPQILSAGRPLIVDVGYGAQAWTALEMFERWLPINRHLRLLGLEIDPDRVAAAQPHIDPGRIDFKLGGFNVLDVIGTERARVIRAYNVLRQYDEAAVHDALRTMALALEPGGLLVEGTSTPNGRFAVFDIYQKCSTGELQHRELVFATNFNPNFAIDPVQFQAVLPKRLIHHALDAHPAAFFEAWRRALTLARGEGEMTGKRRWIYAARALRERFGYPVDTRPRILRRGYLVLRDKLA